MRQTSYQTIEKLIERSLSKKKYKKYWAQTMLKTAWSCVFPHVQDQLKRLEIKHKSVFISLKSPILSHDLRRNTTMILAKMQQKVNDLTNGALVIDKIVFC